MSSKAGGVARLMLFPLRGPGSLLFGPIFQKEVRVAGRKRGTYIVRAVYAVGLALLVSLVFAMEWGERARWADSPHARAQQLQQMAPLVTALIVWSQLVALTLIAPGLTAGAICDEKRARTLPALMTTPLSTGRIVMGKLTGSVVQILILALIPAPLLLAIRVFGGLDARFAIGATAITMSTALLGASIGLLHSVWHRRAAVAMLFSYFALALLQAGPVVAEATWHEFIGGSPEGWLAPTSAPIALGVLSFEAMGQSRDQLPYSDTRLWTLNTIYNLILALGFTLTTIVLLRRALRREGEARRKPAAASRARRHSAPGDAPESSAGEEASRWAARSREPWDNPVLWRELRQPMFGTWTKRITALVGMLLLLSWIYSMGGMQSEGTHATVGVIGMLGVLLAGALMTTGQVSGERESRTWDVLLTTRLSPSRILLAKFLGSVMRLWPVAAAMALHFVPAVLLGALHPLVLPLLALILTGPLVLLSGTGLLFGLLFRRPIVATTSNLLFALTIWLFLPVGLAVVDEVTDRVHEGLTHAAMLINPLPHVVATTDQAFRTAAIPMSDWRLYFSDDLQYPIGEYVPRLVFLWSLCVGVGLGVVWLGAAQFNRLTGRSS